MRTDRSLTRCAVLLASLCLASSLAAQVAGDTTKKTAPNSDLPLVPTRPLTFTTDEGTWMSLDVSPDGRTVVFDLLGDLYTVPLAGGAATRISGGSGFDGQPRYAPDGKQIVFVSDRSGSENLWLIDADGRNPRPLTKGSGFAYVSPDWTPDGNYVVTSKGAGTLDLWMIHKDGGAGFKLTGQAPAAGGGGAPGGGGGPNHFMGANVSPDGRYIYTNARTGGAQYNQMLGSAYQIYMYDRETGRNFSRTQNLGAGMRPAVSPDGQWLAYASRKMAVTGLKLRNLVTGDERWLLTQIQRDDMESRASRDALPGYAWTPDSREIVIAHHGKIWRVDVSTGKETAVPFTAQVDLMLGELAHFDYEMNDSVLTVRQIRGARPSPDGKQLVFSALDKLWMLDLPNGAPRRLTTSTEGEHSPTWSPDGKFIAYVTWTEDGGDIYRVAADGKSKPERLTTQRAFYESPAYNSVGTRIVAARGSRAQREIRNDEINGGLTIMELVWLPATGGATRLITPLNNFGQPHFTSDTTRLYVYESADGLTSLRWDGTDRKVHLKVTGFLAPGGGPNAQPRQADDVQIAPDGTQVLAQIDNKLYLMPMPLTGGQVPTVSVNQGANAAVPARRITRTGGDFVGWNADGRGFYYSLGRSFFSYNLAAANAAVSDSVAKGKDAPKRPAYEATRTDVNIHTPKDRPSGTVALRNARIITMKGDEVIERGDVVVSNNNVVAVGPVGGVTIPAGARSIDVSGKTIMPGLVDIHAHMWPLWGVHATQPYMYLVNLAYGVTTTRDPQTSTTDVLSYGDLVETGDMLGPRVYATGPGVFQWDDVSSAEDAREVMKRYSDHYQTQTLKQYMAGDRKQRQWIIMAAREQRITPTLEGGLDFKKNLTEAMDGYAGIEHTLPIAPLYKDAVQLFARSGTTWTPTLLVQYGGPWAENWWYEHYDIFSDAKLRRFTPFSELERRGLRRPGWFRDNEYSYQLFAEQARKVVEAGGRVGLGGHGQLQGLGVHWELWNIASGGMKPMDVLRVGTIFGAEAIGLSRYIGSVEAGKWADLIVLDRNPLDDIKNTNSIRYVMKNGRLYDGETLSEVWPRQRDVPKSWWMTNDVVTPGEIR
ncbi:MAG: amidohydrolase family protein [Gemmatimonadaceae bacterium]